jgi:hypothetical protein
MTLDDDLAAWAAAVRLPELEADAIFRRVMAGPALVATAAPGLDPAWWREFNAGFATRMIASTRPARRRAALAGPRPCPAATPTRGTGRRWRVTR